MRFAFTDQWSLMQRFNLAIVPAILWLWTWWHLHDEWSLNARYNYGWAVPALAALMFYLRWQTRPNAAPVAAAAGKIWTFALLAVVLPVRLVEIANPDWRLLGWTLAALAIASSFLALWRRGGAGWMRHFAFPVCFTLAAVPWPVQLENFVVQILTRGVTWAAVESAGWIGVGAFPLGNVIELHNGFVGIDEACSGVATLQAGIMVALALGEFFRLNATRRALLVSLGCGWVFVCNVARATVLVLIAARSGFEQLNRWHDTIGTVALISGMIGLVGLAFALRGRGEVALMTDTESPRQSLPGWKWNAAAVAWLALVFVLCEAWYRVHEGDLVTRSPWTARWSDEVAVRRLEIPDKTRAVLHYDNASAAEWQDANGLKWWGFFARWEPSRASRQLVRSHSPDICLPAAGRTFTRELPAIDVRDGDDKLRFRSYEFEQKDRPLFVFVAIEEDKRPRVPEPALEWNTVGRLRAVALGKRNLGQRLLELAVVGADDFARARAELQRTAAGIIN